MAELFESLTFYLGAKRSTHFKSVLLLSFAGGIVLASLGGIFIPFLGVIPGAFLGTYIGGILGELIHKESWQKAKETGMKILLLRFLALAVKLTIFIVLAFWFILKISG